MELEAAFLDAKARLEKLTERPSNDELLKMYGLVKQVEVGDINRKKPGMFDLKGQFKWKAWKEMEGTSKEDAMQQFVDFSEELLGKYKHDN